MSETEVRVEREPSGRAPGRRAGYVAAAAVDLVCLWVVNHLLGWGWPSFLTPSFEDLLPYIQVSLVAGAAINVMWVIHDPEWLRHLAQAGLDVIGLVVAVATWRIFPFDLSSGWETVFRIVLVVSIVGISIATLVELVRLGTGGHHAARTGPAGVTGPHPA
jgi:hypothetical protein